MSCFGIMQGRLVPPEPGHFQSFPRERWQDEFALASQVGLDAIEWIFDVYGEDANPLASDEGIREMQRRCADTRVNVRSLCADYFMDRPFLRSTLSIRNELIEKMRWLIARCSKAGIRRIVVPFVDASRIESEVESAEVLSILQALLPSAETHQVELHLETSLAPDQFARLLSQCPHPSLRVNYDSGNSASLGYRVREEFAAYGDRIGSVHIKDRRLGGGTVPLGSGNADLNAVFRELAKLGYAGDYILQVARSDSGQEVLWGAQNLAWVTERIHAAAGEGSQ